MSDATTLNGDSGSSDGRALRAERTKQIVVDAALEMLNEGELQPTAQMLSDRSGVSIRSIFRLFDDVQSLHAAAIARHSARVAPLFAPPPVHGSRDTRVRSLVAHRARLYEAIMPVRRMVVRVAATSPPIQVEIARIDAFLRAQLADQFEKELATLNPAKRRDMLDALDMLTSLATWDRLRFHQDMSMAAAQRLVVRTVTALLESKLLT